jgi:hypothetical protein
MTHAHDDAPAPDDYNGPDAIQGDHVPPPSDARAPFPAFEDDGEGAEAGATDRNVDPSTIRKGDRCVDPATGVAYWIALADARERIDRVAETIIRIEHVPDGGQDLRVFEADTRIPAVRRAFIVRGSRALATPFPAFEDGDDDDPTPPTPASAAVPAPVEAPAPAKRPYVVEAELSADDTPGGFIASYGIGLAGTQCGDVFIGSGRSIALAVDDALENYATGAPDGPDRWALDYGPLTVDALLDGAGIDAADADSEDATDRFEADCFAEYCRAEFAGSCRISHDEAGPVVSFDDDETHNEAWQAWADGFEGPHGITVAIRVRYSDAPESRAEALARYLDVPVDEAETEIQSEDWIVLTDDEADEAARDAILESVWAFQPWFIASHTPDGIDADTIQAIQGDRCEDANDPLIALIRAAGPNALDGFVQDAIGCDGRGHFLAHYDFSECELGAAYVEDRDDDDDDDEDGPVELFAYRRN